MSNFRNINSYHGFAFSSKVRVTPESRKNRALQIQIVDDGLCVASGLEELLTIGDEGDTNLAAAAGGHGERLEFLVGAKVELRADGVGVLLVQEVLDNEGHFLGNECLALLLESTGAQKANNIQGLDDLFLSSVFGEIA